ncbi:hypothetical protein BB558_002631, partial [Smittium angustum]
MEALMTIQEIVSEIYKEKESLAETQEESMTDEEIAEEIYPETEIHTPENEEAVEFLSMFNFEKDIRVEQPSRLYYYAS